MRAVPDRMTPKEVASLAGVTERSLQRWCKLGKIPARRRGGRWIVLVDELRIQNIDLHDEMEDASFFAQ